MMALDELKGWILAIIAILSCVLLVLALSGFFSDFLSGRGMFGGLI